MYWFIWGIESEVFINFIIAYHEFLKEGKISIFGGPLTIVKFDISIFKSYYYI